MVLNPFKSGQETFQLNLKIFNVLLSLIILVIHFVVMNYYFNYGFDSQDHLKRCPKKNHLVKNYAIYFFVILEQINNTTISKYVYILHFLFSIYQFFEEFFNMSFKEIYTQINKIYFSSNYLWIAFSTFFVELMNIEMIKKYYPMIILVGLAFNFFLKYVYTQKMI